MKAKHTPGPWTADPKTGDVSGTRNGATRLVAKACDEIEYNAHLIAAAPELLKDVETAEAEMTTMLARLPEPYAGNFRSCLARFAKTIAKAKGEKA